MVIEQKENSSYQDVDALLKETKDLLASFKNDMNKLDSNEKQQRLNALSTQIEKTKTELNQLKSSAESQEKATEINEIETQITSIETEYQELTKNFNEELAKLGQEVSGGTNAPAKQPEKKGFKGWFKEQWEELTSKEGWKEHKGKNILRVVGGVGLVGGVVRLGKKIFGKKDEDVDESDDQDENQSKKKKKKKGKKRFRDRTIGKVVKWTAIGVGTGLGIYGLGKRLGRWGKEGATGKDSDKEKFESYEKEMSKPENKEKFENYESLGDKIDNVYKELYGRELNAGYEDELEMEKIAKEQSKGTKHYKGIVPFCLDNQYKTVEGILGQNSSFKTALSEGLEGMINFVKNAGKGFLEMFVDNYMKFLPSWGIFDKAAGSLSEKLEKWKVENENAEKEMQYFFRQSIRVQTYLFQKEDQLKSKIAQKYGISEKDDDKVEKYVLNDASYKNFLNSPTHLAVTVLQQNNIFDDKIGDDVKKIVADMDKERDSILGCRSGEKDILEIINDKKQKSETLDRNDNTKLEKACDGVINDMDNIIEAAEESAWNIYGDLTRLGDANMREYLEKSGLDRMLQSIKTKLMEQHQLLKNGQLDNDKKIALAETLNSVLALKKEAKIGEWAIEKDYDEHGNILIRIPGFLKGSVKNVLKGFSKLCNGEWTEGAEYIYTGLIGTGATIMIAGGVVYLVSKGKNGKRLIKIGMWSMAAPLLPVKWTYKGLMRIKPVRDFGHKINPLKYRGEQGAQVLLKDLCDGKISLEHAGNIIGRKCLGKGFRGQFVSEATEKAWKTKFNVNDYMKGADMRAPAFDAIIKEKCGEQYLNSIKRDKQLYEELVKKRDISTPEIKKAVMVDKRPVRLLKDLLSATTETVETMSDARRAFNKSIDDAIDGLKKSVAIPDSPMVGQIEKELKNLKNSSDLGDEEMKAFTKFIDDGFEVKHLPDMKRLLEIEDTLSSGTKIGERLKQLLREGKYVEFKSLLRNPSLGKAFQGINCEGVIKSFEKTLLKCGGIGGDSAKSLVRSFAKILAKIL